MSIRVAKTEVESIGAFLRQLPLFAGVSESVLGNLETTCFSRRLSKGGYLFLRGDPADAFYLLKSGEFVISLMSPDGRELIINEIHAGDFFGELGLLTNDPRSADAMACQPAEVVGIPRLAFVRLVKSEPEIALRLLEVTARRLMQASEFQSALAFLDAQARLARVLLDLDKHYEKKGYIPISQEELAQRSGLIRQTVAKTLSQWRYNGWLLTGRGNIVVLNRKALSNLLEERSG